MEGEIAWIDCPLGHARLTVSLQFQCDDLLGYLVVASFVGLRNYLRHLQRAEISA